jgi:flavin-dependent dehydrogenase
MALVSRGVQDIVVVDRQRHPCWRIGEAIPPAGCQALQRLGVWEDFLAQRHLLSVGSCASWGAAELGYNDFLLDVEGKGWHLDRAAFDAMLSAAAVGRGAIVVCGFRLRDVEPRDRGGYLLSFEGEDGGSKCFTAGFLVDATGITGGAVRRLGVARNQIDCLAVIGGVFALREPDAVPSQTLLEACEYGWWYASKLPQGRMIAALAVDPFERQRFGEIGTWLAALHETRHVARWLERGNGALANDGRLETALAPSAILSRVVGERWLAVGDAASAYDPVAAQGIVKALGDSEAAADAIAAAVAGTGTSPLLGYQEGVFARFTDYLRLRRHLYERERRWPFSSFWRNRLQLR